MAKKNNFLLVISIFLLILTFARIVLYTTRRQLVNNPYEGTLQELSVAGGVVPHHLLANEMIDDFFRYISSKGRVENIVILGPDHFNVSSLTGSSFISVDPEDGMFKNLSINGSFLQKLESFNLVYSSDFVASDHSIGVMAPFIGSYFSESKILPILISSKATMEEVKELIYMINEDSGSDTIVIASVDFSHYLSPEVADFHDVKSTSVLSDFREDDFEDLEVDSWQALYGARLFARLNEKETVHLIGKGNSADLADQGGEEDINQTTSYLSVVFEKGEDRSEIEKGKTILFTGDIMLGRSVEDLIKRNTMTFPFQKTEAFLRGVDIVVGNLEGPIVYEPLVFPRETLTFNFMPETAEALAWANFDLLSLANNHTFDRGDQGLGETKEILKSNGLGSIGHPISCGDGSTVAKDDIVLIAFNKTFPQNCSDEEMSVVVSGTRAANSDSFIVVMMHWGEEYQLINSPYQKDLAYKLVDSGADAIIGHHPHIVQNIELYKNRPIFYSLGNFVFDQYFSEDTQKGMVLGVELYEDRVRYRLFPIKSRQGQPFLMESGDKAIFFNDLSLRSGAALQADIVNGIVDINR